MTGTHQRIYGEWRDLVVNFSNFSQKIVWFKILVCTL